MTEGRGHQQQQHHNLSFSIRPIVKGRSRPVSDPFAASPVPEPDESALQEASTAAAALDDMEAWLVPGLVVQVLNDNLADGAYRGRTGVVKRVVETYGAELLMDNQDIIQVDQDDCETVIPRLDAPALVVRGDYQRCQVLVRAIGRDIEVELLDGPRKGHRLLLPSSHICRHMALTSS